MTKTADLDKLNNERVETTKMSVAKVIKLTEDDIATLKEDFKPKDIEVNLSRAINILECAETELRWACQYFSWDISTCELLDDACREFGVCLAKLLIKDDEDELSVISFHGDAALTSLAKALATLNRWFND